MGLMGPQEYRRRLPFAWMRNIGSPDEDQEANAKRQVEYLRQGIPAMQIMSAPERWVWDESIFQDVIQRELLLSADTPIPTKMEAFALWTLLAQQAQMKMGVTAPLPQSAGGKPPKGNELSAGEQPFASTNPGIAAQQGGISDENRAASRFESQQKQQDQG